LTATDKSQAKAGCGTVRSVSSAAELTNCLTAFPAGETLVLQKLVPLEHEAGVFYVSMPGARQGHIFSMNFSEPTEVMGDGLTSLRELISLKSAVARWKSFSGVKMSRSLRSMAWAQRLTTSEILAAAFATVQTRRGQNACNFACCALPSLRILLKP
jgi:hypothetical protein